MCLIILVIVVIIVLLLLQNRSESYIHRHRSFRHHRRPYRRPYRGFRRRLGYGLGYYDFPYRYERDIICQKVPTDQPCYLGWYRTQNVYGEDLCCNVE